MIDKSKLMLSNGEMQLVVNKEWILTKRKIIDKVQLLFGHLVTIMKDRVVAEKNGFPSAVVTSTPKIAKGESYQQLPYVLLDYPRCFDKENIFAIRTMFWWGNFFSCTLHLSGSYKTTFLQALLHNTAAIKKNDLYICVNEDEWQHHFEEDNYVAAQLLSTEKIKAILSQQHFIKVAAKFPLHEWDQIDVLLERSFSGMIQLLTY